MQVKKLYYTYPAITYIVKWTVLCTIIAACIGSASSFFLVTLNLATDFREAHWWMILCLPLAGLLVGLLYHYWGKDVEGGNNLIIENIQHPQQRIQFRMAPMVYVGTIVTHLFGGSAGREGTAVQMAGAIADQFSKPFKLSANDRKVLLIAAIAAGFGSVFGTPLAGAIFALEVTVVGRMRYTALFPAFIAGILASLVTDLWQVAHTHYHITEIPSVSPQTILLSIVSGIVFGIVAALYSQFSHSVSGIFKQKIRYAPFRPLIGGCIVAGGVLLLGSSKYIGLGIPSIEQTFSQSMPVYDFVLKMAFTIITLSSGFKGGEVTPLFFIGASVGNALAYIIGLPTGLLAGMGFVAVFAGATNTPLACSVMALELFGSECGVFVTVACVVSYLISGHNGIYRKQLIGEAKNSRFEAYEGKRLSEL